MMLLLVGLCVFGITVPVCKILSHTQEGEIILDKLTVLIVLLLPSTITYLATAIYFTTVNK